MPLSFPLEYHIIDRFSYPKLQLSTSTRRIGVVFNRLLALTLKTRKIMTDNQALSLALVIHDILESLQIDTDSMHGVVENTFPNDDNHVQISYTWDGQSIIVDSVTIDGILKPKLRSDVQILFDIMEEDGTLEIKSLDNLISQKS